MLYTLTKTNLFILVPDEEPIVITNANPAFSRVVSVLKSDGVKKALGVMHESLDLKKSTNGDFFTDKEDNVYLKNGEKIDPVISKRLLSIVKMGLSHAPILKFAENLSKNPDTRIKNQLFSFLNAADDYQITEDGCFTAYKGVTKDYLDCFTKSFNNTPGSVVSMDRSKVDPDPNVTCSSGLHVGARNYVLRFYENRGQRVVLCKINPANVVAVPTDYQNQKMRVCEYEVLEDVGENPYYTESPVYGVEGSQFTPELEVLTNSLVTNNGNEYCIIGEDTDNYIVEDLQTGQELYFKKSREGSLYTVHGDDNARCMPQCLDNSHFVRHQSSGRLNVPTSTVVDAGFKPGDSVYIFIGDNEVELLKKPIRDPDAKITVMSSGRLYVPSHVFEDIGYEEKHVYTEENGVIVISE